MNFARYECDRRKAQSLMRSGAFSLQVGKKIAGTGSSAAFGAATFRRGEGAVRLSNAVGPVRALARLNRSTRDARTLSTPTKPCDDPDPIAPRMPNGDHTQPVAIDHRVVAVRLVPSHWQPRTEFTISLNT
jgi:hypothetical protein